MATEAQKLIGLSLTKIAQSRINRGGISLHKNLLVATVLQKARFIFMEEAYAASYAGEMAPAAAPPQSGVCSAEAVSRLQPAAPPADARAHHHQRRVSKRRRDSEDERLCGDVAKRCCGSRPLEHSSRRLAPLNQAEQRDVENSEEPMEVDRITSLVSVFSFGANSAVEPLSRLGRSVSTPDFCSAQAMELENMQRRTVVAMAV